MLCEAKLLLRPISHGFLIRSISLFVFQVDLKGKPMQVYGWAGAFNCICLSQDSILSALVHNLTNVKLTPETEPLFQFRSDFNGICSNHMEESCIDPSSLVQPLGPTFKGVLFGLFEKVIVNRYCPLGRHPVLEMGVLHLKFVTFHNPLIFRKP